jgi:hypothetical protein
MQLSIMSKKPNNANQYARSNKTTKRVALIEQQIKLFLLSNFNFIVKLITLFLFSFKFNFLSSKSLQFKVNYAKQYNKDETNIILIVSHKVCRYYTCRIGIRCLNPQISI